MRSEEISSLELENNAVFEETSFEDLFLSTAFEQMLVSRT